MLNVSSGAARYPVAGWSAYCSSKAALDMFTRCIAAEHAGRPNAPRVCSLAPGVVNTGMQLELRSADAARFPDQGRFQSLHETQQLTSARETALQVLAWLRRPDFGAEPVADVRFAGP